MIEKAGGKLAAQAARDNGIKLSTFRNAMDRYAVNKTLQKKKPGPRKKVADISDEMRRFLCIYVDDHPVTSYEDIFAAFEKKFGEKTVPQTKLKKYLQKNIAISMQLHKTLVNKDDGQSNVERLGMKDALHHLYEAGVNPSRCVFVGEMAYDVKSPRTYIDGKRRERTRAKNIKEHGKIVVSRQKKVKTELSPTMAFIIAVFRTEVLHQTYKVCEGETTEDDFKKFLRLLISKMERKKMRSYHLIFDDVPDETKAIISAVVEAHHHKAFFIPPCAYTLNPVDEVFENAQWTVLRHKCTEVKDMIWFRMSQVLEDTSDIIIESCINYSFICNCDECDL